MSVWAPGLFKHIVFSYKYDGDMSVEVDLLPILLAKSHKFPSLIDFCLVLDFPIFHHKNSCPKCYQMSDITTNNPILKN
jgi:hypothetical protein